jgi:outer membrane protein assembly factor BamA
MRFNMSIFHVPLRLSYGVPLRELEGDRTSSFTFSIGRAF